MICLCEIPIKIVKEKKFENYKMYFETLNKLRNPTSSHHYNYFTDVDLSSHIMSKKISNYVKKSRLIKRYLSLIWFLTSIYNVQDAVIEAKCLKLTT